LFNPASSQDQSALDVTALMTNVRSTCSDVGDNVQTVVTFDIRARRTNVQGARDVTLPYFITVVQGGTAVVAKRIGRVSIHFDDGQARSSINGQATANVLRSAATLSPEVRKTLTRVRKAGADDAAVDPLARPEIRQAVLRASFEALVGFQLTDEQLKFNATR
jgi:malate synthase